MRQSDSRAQRGQRPRVAIYEASPTSPDRSGKNARHGEIQAENQIAYRPSAVTRFTIQPNQKEA